MNKFNDDMYAAGQPSMYYLEYYSNSLNSSKSFLAKTSGSPPTNITIYKDNERIDINKSSPIQMGTTITNRRNSYYSIIFSICDTPENIIGEYTLEIENQFGLDNDTIYIEGRVLYILGSQFVVPHQVTCYIQYLITWVSKACPRLAM